MKINLHRQTRPRSRYGLRLVCLLASLSLLAGCANNSVSPPQNQHGNHATANHAATPGPTPRIPAFFNHPDQAKPLPAVLDPKQFSDPVVAKAYRYAQQMPEVFAQQPCYCYCDDGHGHRSLLDCYASDHSVGCVLCLKEGLLVQKLYGEGYNAAEIREQIVRGGWQDVKLQ